MDKPWLDYHKQVSLLVERGLHVDDEDAVATFLSKVSYYPALWLLPVLADRPG